MDRPLIRFSRRWKMVRPSRLINVLLLVTVVFVIVYQAYAVTPNPGHSWAEVGDGLVNFAGPASVVRTYTLPDTSTSIITATSGVFGYATRWLTGTTLGTSTLIDNGTVLGINATTSLVTFNVQGTSGVNPFSVASSTGASLFTILQNGNVGVGSSVPSSKLAISGTAGDTSNIFTVASSSGTNWFNVSSNGRIGIGTSTPTFDFHIVKEKSGTNLFVTLDDYDSTAGAFGPRINGRRARGTVASPSAVQANDELAGFGGRGYGATAFDADSSARMSYFASQNWTDANQGTYIAWYNQPDNTNTLTERMRLLSNGNLGIGTTTAAQLLSVAGNMRLTGAFFDGSNASGTVGQVLQSTGTSTQWVSNSLATLVTRSALATGAVTAKAINSTTAAVGGMFNVPSPITVNQMTFTVTTATTPGTVKYCVYNEAGTKVIDITSAAPAVGAVNTAVGSVLLPPGNYYGVMFCATTCNNAISHFTSTGVAGLNAATVPAGKKVLEGTMTMSVAGTCNATLPTITPAVSSTAIGRLDN